MKKIKNLLAVFINCIMGATLASVLGVAPIVGIVALNAIALISPSFGGNLLAGLYAEIWTGELIKKFRTSEESIGWLKKIRNVNQYVSNNVINFVNVGVDPTVLVNNSTYPIGVESLDDANKAVTLDKYQTKATKITDDELHGLSYDKIGSVIERHHDTIAEEKYARALHALAPATHSATTPVILTSGSADAVGTSKRLTRADIIALKSAFDEQKIPTTGRVLVLCSAHVNDLLLEDQKFAEQYYNYASGKIANMYGFEVYEYTNAPLYKVSTKTKIAYGTAATATERAASTAFYAPRVIQAQGETKTYLQDAATSPTTQENLVNFRTYFMCLPLKDEAIGAIVSSIVSA